MTRQGQSVWVSDPANDAVPPQPLTAHYRTRFQGQHIFSRGGELLVMNRDTLTASTIVEMPTVTQGANPVRVEAVDHGVLLLTSHDNAVWHTDGSAAGTRVLTNEGTRVFFSLNSGRPQNILRTVGDTVFFLDEHGLASISLDGELARIAPEVTDVRRTALFSATQSDDRLYIGSTSGGEMAIWESDGTVEGTRKLTADLETPISGSFQPAMAYLDGQVFVGSERSPLWKFDIETALAVQIGPDDVRHLTAHAGHVYFFRQGAHNELQLWRTDGAATEQLTSIAITVSQRWPTAVTSWQGALYFDDGEGRLWRYNDTEGLTNVAEFDLPSATFCCRESFCDSASSDGAGCFTRATLLHRRRRRSRERAVADRRHAGRHAARSRHSPRCKRIDSATPDGIRRPTFLLRRRRATRQGTLECFPSANRSARTCPRRRRRQRHRGPRRLLHLECQLRSIDQ